MEATYCGVVNICKLPGMSSHDVVYHVRRIAGLKRVGHAGTLDPVACGVLLACMGPATRLADYLTVGPKSYRAEILLGVATDSGDVMGEVTGRVDAGHLTEDVVAAALPHFTGALLQQPPRHSAVWIDGRRAYHLAREGQDVEMPVREVTVHAFTPVRFQPGPQARLLADITCARGTYIRSLAHDLGARLGVGGTLSFLARTAVGGYRLEDAVTLEELAADAEAGAFTRHLLAADAALQYLPALELGDAGPRYLQGTEIPETAAPGLYRAYIDGAFVGLARVDKGKARPAVNLQPR